MEQEEKKDENYALNNWKDILKYDPARLLDLGNDFQVLLSQNKPEIDEEARAISNFEKLTEDKSRPISHTLVDATRLLPDIIALALGPGISVAKKAIGKEAAKKVGSKVAKKIVNENTSDIAQAFNNSKLLRRDAKNAAAKKWVRNLYENKEAMNRVAGKSLSDDEIKAVKKELPNAVTEKIKKYNADVDELKKLTYSIKDVEVPFTQNLDILRRHFVDNKILTKDEWEKLGRNLAELPDYDKGISFSRINVDRILKEIPKEKRNIVKDILRRHSVDNKISDKAKLEKLNKALNKYPVTSFNIASKIDDAIIKAGEVNFKTNRELEIKPNYWIKGSKPTPVSDFIASIFNVDFDDPARFNKKDIDTFFDFLEERGIIEPGIKDKWTARQKVSVMRELLSDEIMGQYVKDKWAESEHKKNLAKYYRGE